MNITIAELRQSLVQNEQDYQRLGTSAQSNDKQQEREEEDILSTFSCISPEDLPLKISQSTLAKLESLLSQDFYDPGIMQLVSCIVQAIYGPTATFEANIASLHNWLKDVSFLAEGVEGITLSASIGAALHNNLVIKYAKDESLTHEVFVGLVGTNFLRQFIPNFSFIYGGFSCSAPLIDESNSGQKQIFDYCAFPSGKKEKGMKYALYEAILPSQTVSSSIMNAGPPQFLNWFLQLLLSLQMAYERIGYSHFDLHGSNVVLRRFPPSTLRYPLVRGELLLHSNEIVTIIDYGLSTIAYQGRVYSHLGDFTRHIGQVSNFPLYDAFKFLVSSYFRAQEYHNRGVESLIRKLFSYFTEEPLDAFLTTIGKDYYVLPAQYAQEDLYGLIDLVLTLTDRTSLGNQGNLLFCIEGSCPTTRQIYNYINIDSLKPPRSVFSLYSQYLYLTEKHTRAEARAFLEQINSNARFLRRYERQYRSGAAKSKELIELARSSWPGSIWKALVSYRKTRIRERILQNFAPLLPSLDISTIEETSRSLDPYEDILNSKIRPLGLRDLRKEESLRNSENSEDIAPYNETVTRLKYLGL